MTEKRTERAARLLVGTDFLRAIPSDVADEVAQHAFFYSFALGNIVVSEGCEASHVYIVLEGSLKSIRTDSDGREQVLSVETVGSVLEVATIFMGGRYSNTVVAAEASRAAGIETATMNKLCRRHTELLWQFSSLMACRVLAYSELAAMLSLRSVDQRLAFYLLTIAQDRGVQTDEGCLFELTITRPEIATRLGTVREVVSRSFSHLLDRKLIELRGRLVKIPDVGALRNFSVQEKTIRMHAGR